MSAYFHISNGPSGAASAHAGYISRRQAVGGGLDGVATINAPSEVRDADTYRTFRLAFQAHMRAEQRGEIAAHGNRRGSARTDYRFRFAVPQNMPKGEALAGVRDFMAREFPDAKTVLALHDDTDIFHIHGQSSARLTTGKKIHVSKKDFAHLTRAWGDHSAKLHAKADQVEHGLTDKQTEQVRHFLATEHRQKLKETGDYKRKAASHFKGIEEANSRSEALDDMTELMRHLPRKPERDGDRAVGAAPYTGRDHQQRRYDREDLRAEGPAQKEVDELFRARAEARHAWREGQRREQEKQNQIIEQARQIIEQAKGWFSIEGEFEDAGLDLARKDGRVVVTEGDTRSVALAETGKTLADLEAEFGAISAHTDQRDRWQEAATSQEKALMDEKAPGFEPEYSLPARVNDAPKPRRERDRKRGKSLSKRHRGRNGGMEL